MKSLLCPISDERVNEQVTRLNALMTMITVVVAFAINSLLVMVFLAADFYIRGFTQMKFSPLGFVSFKLNNTLNLPVKQIEKAPKIFAARMGFAISLIFTVLYGMQLGAASVIVAGMLVLFAGLEFAFAFCAGCTIYNYLVLPFYKN